MLPKSKESQDWIRSTRRGQLWGVLGMDSQSTGALFEDNENAQDMFQYSDHEFDKLQDLSPLSQLYDSWFLERQEKEEPQETQTSVKTIETLAKSAHNGHQPTPQLQEHIAKLEKYRNKIMLSRPAYDPLYSTEPVRYKFHHKTIPTNQEDNQPDLYILILDFLPKPLAHVVQIIVKSMEHWLQSFTRKRKQMFI